MQGGSPTVQVKKFLQYTLLLVGFHPVKPMCTMYSLFFFFNLTGRVENLLVILTVHNRL